MGNSTHLLHRLPPDLVPGKLVGDEADALNLGGSCEADDADEGIGVLLALFRAPSPLMSCRYVQVKN
ncbi:unnamed protein product [Musa acuminata subsp. malaccensis]|uniref:(wild Malaysian banana) hypothetical protein n=1 Tax=Musa acuminata subsp. malaccensis TaxID=214687 RepID=A0A804K7W1_MUSAM|nr:unnamed protein product [Musa acuminata subsp. malaccensis]